MVISSFFCRSCLQCCFKHSNQQPHFINPTQWKFLSLRSLRSAIYYTTYSTVLADLKCIFRQLLHQTQATQFSLNFLKPKPYGASRFVFASYNDHGTRKFGSLVGKVVKRNFYGYCTVYYTLLPNLRKHLICMGFSAAWLSVNP